MNRTEKDPLQKRIEITNWILLAVLVGGSLFLRSHRFSLGILLGGLISVINFHWLYRNLLNVFSKHLNRARAALMFRYYLRLAVTAIALYWIISRNLVDVIGLVIGLSVVVLNIMITTLLALSGKNHVEEVI
ncbi:MAG: ATP synthase subunit I [Deltaproteobacteria bacterium]|nr:ATP synthase subunit I [Deltaproteobacteria bacterium]